MLNILPNIHLRSLVVPNTTAAVSKVISLVILHNKLHLSQTKPIYRQCGPNFDYRSVKPGNIVSCSSDLSRPNK